MLTNHLQSLIHRTIRENNEPLNILTFPSHERYEWGLARTGHRFYGFQIPRLSGTSITPVKTWNESYSPLPRNYTVLDYTRGDAQLPPDVPFDIVLCHSRFDQYETAARIAATYHIPLILLIHTLPPPNPAALKQKRGHYHIYISKHSKETWGDDSGIVIEHGIDTDVFSPDSSFARWPHILSVVNDWINRDRECGFHFWRHATEGLPCFALGDTPGLSRSAINMDELIFHYRCSRIFVNTSLHSPVPMSLLEAMSCGCAVVTTSNPMITSLIDDGVNGFIASSPALMRKALCALLADEGLATSVGHAARQTIIDRFSLERHISEWNTELDRISRLPFVGEP